MYFEAISSYHQKSYFIQHIISRGDNHEKKLPNPLTDNENKYLFQVVNFSALVKRKRSYFLFFFFQSLFSKPSIKKCGVYKV